jgi:hypothetical protein
VTGAVTPLISVAVIVDVELVEPGDTVRMLGEGLERPKSKAAGVTTKLKVAV